MPGSNRLGKTRRFLSRISTLDLWMSAFRSSQSSIQRTTASLSASLQQLRPPQPPTLVDESFEQAVQRLHLDNFKLLVRYQQLRLATLVMLALLLLCLGMAGFFVLQQHWTGAIGSIGVIAIAVAYCLSHSFRAWQIRHRQLGQFHYFLRRPQLWWPHKLDRL